MWEIFWIFPLLLLLIMVGLPVGIALFTTTLTVMLIHSLDITPIAHLMYQTMDSFVLSALPIFMLMANILYQANIGEDLFELMSVFLRKIKGGLSIATILACGFFAAISGSSAATVITIGIVAIPAMFSRNYNRKVVLGTVGAGGLLGVLIPPSGWMIIYGDLAEVSVGKLFIAGVVPGILLMFIFAALAWAYSRRTASGSGALESASWEEKKMAFRRAFAALWLPPFVLGGIYAGVFTPVESASVGTTYAFLISIRRLKKPDYWAILKNTVVMTSMLFFVIKTAVVFGSVLTLLQIPQKMATFVVEAGFGPIMFILVMSVTYFVLGCFVDGVCMLLLTVPIILPILTVLQIDLVWYCIIMVVNMEIGCITPPFGVNLFALWGIVRDASMGELLQGIFPFFIALVLFLGIIIAFPSLSTWLPNLMGF
jgi:C4-dicarboxylate transporter, DctM subunit